MQPHLNPSSPPAFHELDEYAFQNLCCDLFAEEESVATCDVYGTRGQTQRGIDLLAPRRDGDGNEVGQCKCYQELSVAEINDAADKFFEHLGYWEERKVRRFVLIAACPLDRTQQQEAIQEQRVRFAQRGIAYEAWSTTTLRQKLRPHRAIAQRYISSREVIDSICGRTAGDVVELPAGGAHLVVALEAAGSQIAQLSSALSREKASRLEEARTLLRRGQRNTAYGLTRAIYEDPTWNTLENPLRARVLRVLASCMLDIDGDLARARALTDEARTLDPTASDSVIRAVIRYHENGPRAALDGLSGAQDVDTLNYQLGLLLEIGDAEELLATLANRSGTISVNADTLRMHALALITKKDLAAARKAIEQAMADQPEWEGVRMAAGIVEYYSAMSAAALPDQLSSVPGPVPWEFIKRDDESREYLRSAESRFHLLATNPERPVDWHRVFSMWRFACLANDPNRQTEASELCRSLLSEQPGDSRMLMWALARGYEVDVAAARKVIEANLPSIPSPDAAAILVALMLSQGKAPEALELLDRTKDAFVQTALLERWLFLRVQALLAGRTIREALDVADSAEDAAARRQLRQLALQGKFEHEGEWQELLQHLESSLEETGDPRFLYEACSLKARVEDWHYVANRAERLVTAIGTPAAVRLAAGSLWNAGGLSAACLKLLNETMPLFPSGSLPRELRLLRIRCMQEVGLVSSAVLEAENLSHEEKSTESFLALIQSQVLTGDLKGVAVSARSLLDRDDTPPGELLRVGRLLVSEDANLARQLWRRAVQFGLSESSAVVAAVDLAFRLGLEDEARPLLQRMHELAVEGAPAVQRVEFAELISIRRSRAEQVQTVQGAYQSGQVPVHVVAQLLNIPLASLVPGTGRRNRINPDPRRQPPMLIRHGGRAMPGSGALGGGVQRLHIDVTGLLVAHDLGVLDAVEQCFKPLRISPSAVPALLVELDILSPTQPAHLSGERHVLELAERGVLGTIEPVTLSAHEDPDLVRRMGDQWVGLLERARSEEGYLVEYLPLTSNDETRAPVVPSERDAGRVINCRSLIDALRRDGVLSSEAHAKAIERLGTEGIQRSDRDPPERGSIVYLIANIAGVLADSHLLVATCDHFQVRVEPRYIEQVRGEIAHAAAAEAVREWLRTLVDRVRAGLSSGIYETVRVDDALPKLDALGGKPLNLEVQALGDLLAFEAHPGDAIWIDDRYASSFSNRDGAPTVGVLDVLQALRLCGAVDETQYYEKVLQLRASNARYIPLTPDELLHYLKDAPIAGGCLVETAALATLRQHVAACLLDRATIQRGPKPQDWSSPYGEVDFVFQTLSAVNLALAKCFTDAPSSETAEARADWLFYSLHAGCFGVRELLFANTSGTGLDVIGRDWRSLCWGC